MIGGECEGAVKQDEYAFSRSGQTRGFRLGDLTGCVRMLQEAQTAKSEVGGLLATILCFLVEIPLFRRLVVEDSGDCELTSEGNKSGSHPVKYTVNSILSTVFIVITLCFIPANPDYRTQSLHKKMYLQCKSVFDLTIINRNHSHIYESN